MQQQFKRLFRTQLQGMEESSTTRKPILRNMEASHQDTTGWGFKAEVQSKLQINLASQDSSKGRSENGSKSKNISSGSDGKKIEIKYKKLQSYLRKGFTQI